MKLTLKCDKAEQIKAGIEPCDEMTVDVPLSELTTEQREVLTHSTTIWGGITGSIEEVRDIIQKRVEKDAENVARENAERAKRDDEARAACANATLNEQPCHEEGVQFTKYTAPFIWNCGLSEDVARLVTETTERLTGEARKRTEESRAAVVDLIAASRATREAEEAEKKAQAEAEKRSKFAKRLETGIVEIPLSRGDRSDWGEPWIAKVTTANGRKPVYDFDEGSYDLASEILSIPCKPGEVVAWGQKNYRKPKRTIHEVRVMRPDGSLASA